MLNNGMIKRIISTLKSEYQKKNGNIYTFYVDPSANKFQLKEAIEKAFDIKVERISSLREKPVLRNSRSNVRTKLKKKIFVKLREGYKIGGNPGPERMRIDIDNPKVDDLQK